MRTLCSHCAGDTNAHAVLLNENDGSQTVTRLTHLGSNYASQQRKRGTIAIGASSIRRRRYSRYGSKRRLHDGWESTMHSVGVRMAMSQRAWISTSPEDFVHRCGKEFILRNISSFKSRPKVIRSSSSRDGGTEMAMACESGRRSTHRDLPTGNVTFQQWHQSPIH